jgi:hypothetical protein
MPTSMQTMPTSTQLSEEVLRAAERVAAWRLACQQALWAQSVPLEMAAQGEVPRNASQVAEPRVS